MRILFQGDSITEGGCQRDSDPNHTMGQSYPYIISSLFGFHYPERKYEFLNRGISGNTCAQLCGRWQEDALNLKPDVISILVGTNDAGRESRSEKELAYHGMMPFYELLLKQTREILPETRLVLMEPFLLDCGNFDKAVFKRRQEYLADYQSRIRELAKTYDAIFVPLQERFCQVAQNTSPTYWIWDSVHPTCAGHGLIADAWMKDAGKVLLGGG